MRLAIRLRRCHLWEHAGPDPDETWRRSTAKPGKVYLHVFDWLEGGEIRVGGLEASGAYLMADSGKSTLALRQAGEDAVISGPVEAPDAITMVVVLDV